jgi:hypothetical protein
VQVQTNTGISLPEAFAELGVQVLNIRRELEEEKDKVAHLKAGMQGDPGGYIRAELMKEIERQRTEQEALYMEGIKVGLAAFAWWKEGTCYVGTCGRTLKEALAMVDNRALFGQRQWSNTL